jgi:integrase
MKGALMKGLLVKGPKQRGTEGERAKCDCLVFTTRVRTPLDTHNVRRHFRKVAEAAGLTAGEWTPRELRHSFVSLLSDDGMPIEHIARLVGHISTAVTETVYRQQIRPVIIQGAEAMDRIFRPETEPEA